MTITRFAKIVQEENSMGLDMYLTKRTYVKRWEHTAPEKQYLVSVKQGSKTVPKNKIDPMKVSYIEQEVGYWRKANHIHNWFIENCAGGEDDCKPVYVDREKLQELLKTVNKVLKASKLVTGKVQNGSRGTPTGMEPIIEDGRYIEDPSVAQKLLPTQSGFFFGSEDYDQWYYQDLVDTKKILTEALKDTSADFQYEASW